MRVVPKTYPNYPEVLLPVEAAELCGVSNATFYNWLSASQAPMGSLIEGKHYYKVGREYRIIKRQLALLFGMVGDN